MDQVESEAEPHPDYAPGVLANVVRGASSGDSRSRRGLSVIDSLGKFCSDRLSAYATFVTQNGAKRREHDQASKAIYLRRRAEDIRQGKPRPDGVRWVPEDERKEYERLVQPEPPGVGWQILFDAYRELARIAESGRLKGTGFPESGGIKYDEIPSDAWRFAQEPNPKELLASEVILNGQRFRDVRFLEVKPPDVDARSAKRAEVINWMRRRRAEGYVWKNNATALAECRASVDGTVSEKVFLEVKGEHGDPAWKIPGAGLKRAKVRKTNRQP